MKNSGNTKELDVKDDSGFSFHCGSADDDDEVTESKIKAFLDDKVWNASTPKISLHVIHLMKPKRELMYIIEGLGTEEIANTIIQGIPEH